MSVLDSEIEIKITVEMAREIEFYLSKLRFHMVDGKQYDHVKRIDAIKCGIGTAVINTGFPR